jgi:ATP-binding cassette subfamily B protein
MQQTNFKFSKKQSVLVSLITYLRPYSIMMLGVFISLLFTSAATLLISQSIKLFIDQGIAQGSQANLNKALVSLVLTILMLAIFTFCRFSLITLVGEKVVADMRRDIFRHILYLSPSFFERNKSGELLSRLVADTTLLLSVIGSSLSIALRNAVMLIGGVVVLVSINSSLASMLLVIIPMVITPLFLMRNKLRLYARFSQDKVADLTSQTEQVLGALKVVQSYQRESFEMKRFDNLLQVQIQAAKKRVLIRGTLTATVIFMAFLGIGVVLWNGGTQVLNGTLSAGDLSAFIYVAIVCAGTVAALSDVAGDLQKAIGATERIFEFLITRPDVKEQHNAIAMSKEDFKTLEFKNVEFSYDSNKKRKTLQNINFHILPSAINALVGKSGSGKTTLFMLLERFYDITAGQILINDIDIRQLKLQDLRSIFTYVPQEAYVFSTTVYENILYGNPNATEDMVIEAARQARCMEFIEKMPEGIYTDLGDKGLKLSGGQKQRLAIARAILNDPKVLLLDEATSALDAENEHLVQEALNHLMQGRTTIAIAHRLATIKGAQQIIVLENGEVAESGTHEQLMQSTKGVYKRLAKMQAL